MNTLDATVVARCAVASALGSIAGPGPSRTIVFSI